MTFTANINIPPLKIGEIDWDDPAIDWHGCYTDDGEPDRSYFLYRSRLDVINGGRYVVLGKKYDMPEKQVLEAWDYNEDKEGVLVTKWSNYDDFCNLSPFAWIHFGIEGVKYMKGSEPINGTIRHERGPSYSSSGYVEIGKFKDGLVHSTTGPALKANWSDDSEGSYYLYGRFVGHSMKDLYKAITDSNDKAEFMAAVLGSKNET